MKPLLFRLTLLLFSASSVFQNLSSAIAVPAVPDIQQLAHLENRFFFHRYEHDTFEKRLQRLELLVFGATQEGSNWERFSRLRNKVLARDNASRNSPNPHIIASNRGSGSSRILNTLEMKILKRAHTGEAIDKRLNALEEKLFGQASPQMPPGDRIERLKKAAGFQTPEISTLPLPITPGQPSRPGGMPFIAPFEYMNPYQQSPFSELVPNMEQFFGSQVPGQLDPRLARMFQQLNQRLRELRQLPPGGNRTDPQYPLKPDTFPYSPFPKPNAAEAIPRQPSLPPYYDPNSI